MMKNDEYETMKQTFFQNLKEENKNNNKNNFENYRNEKHLNDKSKNKNENFGISRPYMDPATSKVNFLAASHNPASAGGSGRSYTDARADKSIDFNNDIYFIFAYTDEIVNS